jgi:Fe-S cluster assembly scaffold protein SufB
MRFLNIDLIKTSIINLNVEGASVEFVGRYKTKDSLCDVSCIVNHNASHTKSKINVRGIADVNGKIISRSNILVTENIKRVVGEEKVKFIFVTDENGQTGEIDTIPNLDIASHEVVVSHAMSVSKIKKADIWYAGLHGASEKEAEKSFEESFLN